MNTAWNYEMLEQEAEAVMALLEVCEWQGTYDALLLRLDEINEILNERDEEEQSR
jgi:hypothetical protein